MHAPSPVLHTGDLSDAASRQGEPEMAKYKDKEIGAKALDPHVYAMGEAAFKHVKRCTLRIPPPVRLHTAQAPFATGTKHQRR